MKTKMKLFVALFLMLFSQTGTFATPVEMNVAIEVLTGTYTAQIALSPVAGTNATISVSEFFGEITGFENAILSAEISNGGATLTAILSGVTTSELPENTVLGQIKLVDANGQRSFTVFTDGGNIIVSDDTF